MWHNGFGYGMDPGLFFAAGLFKFLWFLLLLALIFGAIRFFRRMRYAGPGGWQRHGGWNPQRMMGNWGAWGRDEAMETARERLARSEISPEQFEEIKRGLQGNEARGQQFERADWHDMKRGWKGAWGRDNALETARMRLAKGEISTEEFEMIRRTLEN
jgi:uncharacterized membrane protein